MTDEELVRALRTRAGLETEFKGYATIFRRAADRLESLAKPGVTVKSLDWGSTSYGRPEVETVVGFYRINEALSGGWTVTAGKRALPTNDGRNNWPTIDAAKAAAQADYERRVLSALSSHEPAPEARIAELVEALEPFARMEHVFIQVAEGGYFVGCDFGSQPRLNDFRRARATLKGQSNEA